MLAPAQTTVLSAGNEEQCQLHGEAEELTRQYSPAIIKLEQYTVPCSLNWSDWLQFSSPDASHHAVSGAFQVERLSRLYLSDCCCSGVNALTLEEGTQPHNLLVSSPHTNNYAELNSEYFQLTIVQLTEYFQA